MDRTPFDPPAGVVSDDTVFSAPGRYKDMAGARFYQGRWQTRGGFESLTFSLLTGVCRTVFGWTDISNVLNLAFGMHNGLMVWKQSVLTDITPVSGFTAGAIDGTGSIGYSTGTYGTGTYGSPSNTAYYPLTWSLASYETGDLYANPRGQGIFRWQQNVATPAATLANSPAQCTAILSTQSRQIMALGCSPLTNNSGPLDPLTIRVSDIEDPTDWTPTTSNNADEIVLNGGGRIVGGVVLGAYVLVFTDEAAFLGTFVGDPAQSWRFDKVGEHCGLIGPNAAVVGGTGNAQTVSWISPDIQFWGYQLGGVPTPMDCPIRKDFADNLAIGQNDKIVASTTTAFKEVTWYYPDSRDGMGLENSRSITLSDEGWWPDQLARTAYCDAPPGSPSPVGVTYGGNIYWHEQGQSADGAALSGFVESTDFYLNDAQSALKIEGVYPDFKDQVGAVMLTAYVRNYAQDTERTYGPYRLTVGLSKKSFRFSGAIVRLRFDWSSAPAYARCGKMEFETDMIGSR